jgi:hypothetical protein
MLPTNRSMPRCSVIPELAYADVGQADVDRRESGGTPGKL